MKRNSQIGKKKNQSRYCLYFDGASKHNPEKAGARARGIILDPNGKENVTYEWGLGQISNNKVESYSMLMGTRIIKKREIQNPIIIERLSHNNRGNEPKQKSKQ